MYLERISFEVEDKIRQICEAPDFADNAEKSRYLSKYLAKHGFKLVGSGTNRATFKLPNTSNGKYDVVYKIALDSRGVKDNFNEYNLFIEAPEFVVDKMYFIEAFEKSENDIILVSREADIVMDIYSYKSFKKDIHQMFEDLDPTYLLDDMDPNNLGIIRVPEYGQNNKDYRVTIIDSANLVLKKDLNMYCTAEMCEDIKDDTTYLNYTPDMKQMFCPRCGTHYTFADIKGTCSEESETDVRRNFLGRSSIKKVDSIQDQLLNAIQGIMDSEDNYDYDSYDNSDYYSNIIDECLGEQDFQDKVNEREEELAEVRNEIQARNSFTGRTLTPSMLNSVIEDDDYEDDDTDDDYGYPELPNYYY